MEAMDRTGTQWAPYLEWSLSNPTYSDNPFDLIASVTFVHQGSGETRNTEMFYAGEATWKFRFTATRTGQWTFTTSSNDSDLNGHSGTITISPNPDPKIKGFLVNSGNKFARQTGENGALEAFVFNVWQSGHSLGNNIQEWFESPDYKADLDKKIENELKKHGMPILYSGLIANRWFNIHATTWEEHNSENPDPRTFEALEKAITHLHSQGYQMHIWMWGDSERKQNQTGVGGINGTPDRRLQRYIAARLGPIPGWSMGYGFDLGEWVSESQLDSWAGYLKERMGWPHLLFSRGYAPGNMGGVSYSSNGPGKPTGAIQTSPNGPASYSEVARHLDSDRNRPHLYEERFIFLREMAGGPAWTMDRTRKVLWWNTMAGGMGSFWGYWDGPLPTNPEQMRTHARFWRDRFNLQLERANDLTDGLALKTPSNTLFVFYKEDATSIRINLAGISDTRAAVAVDTKKEYAEIKVTLKGGEQTWTAPYKSDWAVAVSSDIGTSSDPEGPTIFVNFQTSNSVTPHGYHADDGSVFGQRPLGMSFGWNIDNRANARERNATSSKALDTLNHMDRDGVKIWEISIPNGTYEVRIAAGDPAFPDGAYLIEAEGIQVLKGVTGGSNPWVWGIAEVKVSDGRLTVTNGSGSQNNKINYIAITPVGAVKYKTFVPSLQR